MNLIFIVIIAALLSYVAWTGLGVVAAVCTFLAVFGALKLVLRWFIESRNNLIRVHQALLTEIKKSQK